jgi:aldose 1-epimerase
MTIRREQIGEWKDRPIELVTLTNSNGLRVKVMNYGATVTSICSPNGTEITCGFDSFSEYVSRHYLGNYAYFGSTIGRVANRIKYGRFTLDEKVFTLAKNNGSNHLHGGWEGFDKKVWSVNEIEQATDKISVNMSLISPDGEEGYPGNVSVQLTFTLTNENELILDYSATADAPAPLSLTNHIYFNLSGFKQGILSHELTLASDRYLHRDESGCPDGHLIPVNGKFDFRNGKSLHDVREISQDGLDHYFLLNQDRDVCAVLRYGDTSLFVSTTEPGMQVYSSKFVPETLSRNAQQQYGNFCALCFEPSNWPNGVNIPGSPDCILRPGKVYSSKTIFKFEMK